MLYKTLEYNSPAWAVLYIGDSEALERTQRQATKLLHSIIKDLICYPKSLQFLDLPTLVCRRKRADLIHIFRMSLQRKLSRQTM